MAGSNTSDALTGAELIRLWNSRNVQQKKDLPLSELSEWLREEDINADVLIIGYLREIDRKLGCLPSLIEEQIKTNNFLKEMF